MILMRNSRHIVALDCCYDVERIEEENRNLARCSHPSMEQNFSSYTPSQWSVYLQSCCSKVVKSCTAAGTNTETSLLVANMFLSSELQKLKELYYAHTT